MMSDDGASPFRGRDGTVRGGPEGGSPPRDGKGSFVRGPGRERNLICDVIGSKPWGRRALRHVRDR